MSTLTPSQQPAPRRIWWRALLLAAPAFVLGIAFGGYFVADHYTRLRPAFAAAFDEHMVSQYAVLQYKQASYPEAQAALERNLRFLESEEAPQSLFSDPKSRALDAMLTWGRLALLHERNGQPQLAAQAWVQAEALAKQATWRDPSRQRIRSFLDRIDAEPGPLPTPKPGA
jgi:hypothetical protein